MNEPSAARVAVVGLGNPGSDYQGSRHNVGFEVVDRIAGLTGEDVVWREECSAAVAEVGALLLVKPLTWMNRSGLALRCLLERGHIEPTRLLVVFDDVALPLGTLRLRGAGGPGGHRGLESVLEHLRSDEVARLRCGIADGLEREELSEFVLGQFGPDEQPIATAMVDRAASACLVWSSEGLEIAANRFNGAPRLMDLSSRGEE